MLIEGFYKSRYFDNINIIIALLEKEDAIEDFLISSFYNRVIESFSKGFRRRDFRRGSIKDFERTNLLLDLDTEDFLLDLVKAYYDNKAIFSFLSHFLIRSRTLFKFLRLYQTSNSNLYPFHRTRYSIYQPISRLN